MSVWVNFTWNLFRLLLWLHSRSDDPWHAMAGKVELRRRKVAQVNWVNLRRLIVNRGFRRRGTLVRFTNPDERP